MHHYHFRPHGLMVVLVLLLLCGCTNRHPGLESYLRHTNIASKLELRETPFFHQQDNQCGPAAKATNLAASGISIRP